MSRSRFAALLAASIALAVIAGCGGGGGGAKTTPQPPVTPPLSGTFITGTVVSSVGGRGVGGVVVRLGDSSLAATTDSGGSFQINIGSESADLPDHFQVDTSGAGASFPASGLITYNNGQTYYPDWVDMPVVILNADTRSLGTITVSEVTDTTNPPSVPYPSKDTVMLGRVARLSDGTGVANVRVEFGWTPVNITRTGARGFFSVNLGRDATVLPLFPADTWPPTFRIDTTGTAVSPTLQVELNGQTTAQDAIVVPTEVLTSQSATIGTITVLDDTGGGGNNPPEPPLPPLPF